MKGISIFLFLNHIYLPLLSLLDALLPFLLDLAPCPPLVPPPRVPALDLDEASPSLEPLPPPSFEKPDIRLGNRLLEPRPLQSMLSLIFG